MIIIYSGYGLLYLALGIGALFLIGGSLFYVIKDTAENFEDWRDDYYSTGRKICLLVLTVATLAGVPATAYGMIHSNGVIGTIGLLSTLFCGCICTALGSPIKIITASSNAGCIGTLLVIPSTLISCLLGILVGWIFALIVVFRESTWKLRLGAALALIGLVVGIVAIPQIQAGSKAREQAHKQQQQAQVAQRDQELITQLVADVKDDIANATLEPFVLTEEESQALERLDYPSPLYHPDCIEFLAETLSYRYREKDFDSILKLVDYMDVNDAHFVSAIYFDTSIWFTDDFIEFMITQTQNRGEKIQNSGLFVQTYSYGDWRIDIHEYHDFVMIRRDLTLDGKSYSVYLSLENLSKRREDCEKYDEPYHAYYLVGDDVTFHNE